MKKTVILLSIALLLPCAAFAQDAVELFGEKAQFTKAELDAAASDPLRFTIDPASIKTELVAKYTTAPAAEEERGAIGTIWTIVNIANKIWKVIERNAPVVDVETKYAAAVPEQATSPNQLCEWKGPETYEYKFHAKNLYGAETVSVSYKVLFNYGGKFDNKGAYLTGVTIVPGSINVAWGYKLSMGAFVADTTITNIGTYEDPVAAMQLKLSSKIASVLKEWDGNSVYLISGDGKLKEIVSPFAQEKTAASVKASGPLLAPATVFNGR